MICSGCRLHVLSLLCNTESWAYDCLYKWNTARRLTSRRNRELLSGLQQQRSQHHSQFKLGTKPNWSWNFDYRQHQLATAILMWHINTNWFVFCSFRAEIWEHILHSNRECRKSANMSRSVWQCWNSFWCQHWNQHCRGVGRTIRYVPTIDNTALTLWIISFRWSCFQFAHYPIYF